MSDKQNYKQLITNKIKTYLPIQHLILIDLQTIAAFEVQIRYKITFKNMN